MKFGEYLPDLPARDNPGLTIAKNCVPHAQSYKSISAPVVYSNALTFRCRGSIAVKDKSGNIYNFAGDKTTLYLLSGLTYSSKNLTTTDTDVTFTAADTIATAAGDYSIFKDGQLINISGTNSNNASWDTGAGHTITGTPTTTTITTTGTPAIVNESAGDTVVITRKYNTPASVNWEFAKWGEKVIAVNGHNDNPQIITFGGTSFDDLGGSPPQAKHIGIVRDFVVFGDIDDGTVRPNKLVWSAINNEAGWTAGTNQSDGQELPSGGWVQAIVGGEYGVIFCENSIYRMDYVGYPIVFQFNEVESGRGTPAPKSVINIGKKIFYLGIDGFYMFHESSSVNIGVNRVDKTFYADLDQNYYDRVNATIDPINSLVFWAYPGSGNQSGLCNRVIVYNWATNKWAGPIEVDSEVLINSFSEGADLDSLTTSLGYTNIDTLPFPLDSRAWQGGAILLSSFDANHKLNNFTGDALDATFETGEFTDDILYIDGVRPLFDGSGTASAQIGTRDTVNSSVTYGPVATTNSRTGYCDYRSTARYNRLRLNVEGGFSHVYGAEIRSKKAGKV